MLCLVTKHRIAPVASLHRRIALVPFRLAGSFFFHACKKAFYGSSVSRGRAAFLPSRLSGAELTRSLSTLNFFGPHEMS